MNKTNGKWRTVEDSQVRILCVKDSCYSPADILHLNQPGCSHFDTIDNVREAFEVCQERNFKYPEGISFILVFLAYESYLMSHLTKSSVD